jgi:signal transduction histidine kinase
VELSTSGGAARLGLDERLVRHILVNLLSNALKYSPVDSVVRLTVATRADELVFEVEDAGIGIPEDDLPTLFEPFHRGANAADFDGTGLGLAMVKRCVDVHRGSIVVDSRIGRGTRFSVRLPASAEVA